MTQPTSPRDPKELLGTSPTWDTQLQTVSDTWAACKKDFKRTYWETTMNVFVIGPFMRSLEHIKKGTSTNMDDDLQKMRDIINELVQTYHPKNPRNHPFSNLLSEVDKLRGCANQLKPPSP